jgi:hypothetical protein
LTGKERLRRRQRLEDSARLGPLIARYHRAVVRPMVGVHVGLGRRVVRRRRQADPRRDRGHDEERHGRSASAGESGAPHAQG